jgi:hypothetical protein
MGGRQQQRQPAAEVVAKQRRPLRADGAKHAAEVVHPVLERVPGRSPVRQAVAEAVAEDQPGERRQPV